MLVCYKCHVNIGKLAFVGFAAVLSMNAQCFSCCRSSILTIILLGPWALFVLTVSLAVGLVS